MSASLILAKESSRVKAPTHVTPLSESEFARSSASRMRLAQLGSEGDAFILEPITSSVAETPSLLNARGSSSISRVRHSFASFPEYTSRSGEFSGAAASVGSLNNSLGIMGGINTVFPADSVTIPSQYDRAASVCARIRREAMAIFLNRSTFRSESFFGGKGISVTYAHKISATFGFKPS